MPILEEECKIEKIEKSLLPYIYILHATCKKCDFVMDVHEDILIFKDKDIVEFYIDSNKPTCNTKTDLCGTGYVVTIKKDGVVSKLIISIGGFMLIVSSKEIDFIQKFKPLMKTYIKLSKRG